jgi:hypothetical protein
MRLGLATVAAGLLAAIFTSAAGARVISVTRVNPTSCGLGITVDGTFTLLDGTSGVIAETDLPAFPGAPFNIDQLFVCHGKTPPGLVSSTMRIVESAPTPYGNLLAHITITPKVWTFAVVKTGQKSP